MQAETLAQSIAQPVGASLVVLALADIFITVLYARTNLTFLTPRLYRVAWRAFELLVPHSFSKRDLLLSLAGPLMLAMTITLWIAFLILGFALIAWPDLGGALRATSGATGDDFGTAMYYAGYSLTTLGAGTIVPNSSTQRALMVGQGIIGFAVITLALTYFMSLYGALVRRNALAQALHQLSGGTGRSGELLRALAAGGSFQGASTTLMSIGTQIGDLTESHRSYPLLHYFRMQDARYSTARLAWLVLDALSLMRARAAGACDDLVASAPYQLAWNAARELARESARSFKSFPEPGVGPSDVGRAHHFDVVAASNAASNAASTPIDDDRVIPDRATYLELRQEWEPDVLACAEAMGLHWSRIEAAESDHRPIDREL